MKYLYALMDDETRFWIAQQVADTKYTANINPLFKEGKQLIGKRPNTLMMPLTRNFTPILIRKLDIFATSMTLDLCCGETQLLGSNWKNIHTILLPFQQHFSSLI